MLHKVIRCVAFLFVLNQAAMAQDAVVKTIPDAKMVGQARLSVLMMDVYDATLYAPGGSWAKDKPFALSVRYFRSIDAKDIVDRTIEEMRGQGFEDTNTLNAWHAEMTAIFPDVRNGTVLTAIFIPGQHTQFYQNGRYIGKIAGDNFLRRFSDIWLSAKSSQPALRKKLLGLS